ncbi:MAG: polysaccharide pyruvyl transferase family protein [Bacteroidaceae bacterium]
MKIKIITIHNIPNFGSVFQTYALCQFLKESGYNDVEVVDYNPSYFKPHSLRTIAAMLLNLKSYIVRKHKFDSFIKQHIPLTNKTYRTLAELKNANFDADIFIAGGDQLWNVYHECGKDDAYKMTFFKGKKMSYSTSMGQFDFSEKDLNDLANKIRDFSSVSVRETSSVDLLNKVGIKATACVDPVYLLSVYHYKNLLPPIEYKKYLLVYLVNPSELLERCIKYLSKKHNLEVILCSGFSKKCTCDKFIKSAGPDEIMNLIKHADIVLSSSFHATSFSLLFEIQFFTILPDAYTNERIVDLLKVRGLSERIITESSDIETELSKSIDYDSVFSYNDKIDAAKNYLLNKLKQ